MKDTLSLFIFVVLLACLAKGENHLLPNPIVFEAGEETIMNLNSFVSGKNVDYNLAPPRLQTLHSFQHPLSSIIATAHLHRHSNLSAGTSIFARLVNQTIHLVSVSRDNTIFTDFFDFEKERSIKCYDTINIDTDLLLVDCQDTQSNQSILYSVDIQKKQTVKKVVVNISLPEWSSSSPEICESKRGLRMSMSEKIDEGILFRFVTCTNTNRWKVQAIRYVENEPMILYEINSTTQSNALLDSLHELWVFENFILVISGPRAFTYQRDMMAYIDFSEFEPSALHRKLVTLNVYPSTCGTFSHLFFNSMGFTYHLSVSKMGLLGHSMRYKVCSFCTQEELFSSILVDEQYLLLYGKYYSIFRGTTYFRSFLTVYHFGKNKTEDIYHEEFMTSNPILSLYAYTLPGRNYKYIELNGGYIMVKQLPPQIIYAPPYDKSSYAAKKTLQIRRTELFVLDEGQDPQIRTSVTEAPINMVLHVKNDLNVLDFGYFPRKLVAFYNQYAGVRVSDYLTGPGIRVAVQGAPFVNRDVNPFPFEILDENSQRLQVQKCTFAEFKRSAAKSDKYYLFLQCQDYAGYKLFLSECHFSNRLTCHKKYVYIIDGMVRQVLIDVPPLILISAKPNAQSSNLYLFKANHTDPSQQELIHSSSHQNLQELYLSRTNQGDYIVYSVDSQDTTINIFDLHKNLSKTTIDASKLRLTTINSIYAHPSAPGMLYVKANNTIYSFLCQDDHEYVVLTTINYTSSRFIFTVAGLNLVVLDQPANKITSYNLGDKFNPHLKREFDLFNNLIITRPFGTWDLAQESSLLYLPTITSAGVALSVYNTRSTGVNVFRTHIPLSTNTNIQYVSVRATPSTNSSDYVLTYFSGEFAVFEVFTEASFLVQPSEVKEGQLFSQTSCTLHVSNYMGALKQSIDFQIINLFLERPIKAKDKSSHYLIYNPNDTAWEYTFHATDIWNGTILDVDIEAHDITDISEKRIIIEKRVEKKLEIPLQEHSTLASNAAGALYLIDDIFVTMYDLSLQKASLIIPLPTSAKNESWEGININAGALIWKRINDTFFQLAEVDIEKKSCHLKSILEAKNFQGILTQEGAILGLVERDFQFDGTNIGSNFYVFYLKDLYQGSYALNDHPYSNNSAHPNYFTIEKIDEDSTNYYFAVGRSDIGLLLCKFNKLQTRGTPISCQEVNVTKMILDEEPDAVAPNWSFITVLLQSGNYSIFIGATNFHAYQLEFNILNSTGEFTKMKIVKAFLNYHPHSKLSYFAASQTYVAFYHRIEANNKDKDETDVIDFYDLTNTQESHIRLKQETYDLYEAFQRVKLNVGLKTSPNAQNFLIFNDIDEFIYYSKTDSLNTFKIKPNFTVYSEDIKRINSNHIEVVARNDFSKASFYIMIRPNRSGRVWLSLAIISLVIFFIVLVIILVYSHVYKDKLRQIKESLKDSGRASQSEKKDNIYISMVDNSSVL